MAPQGPILPRKSTALARSKGSIESVAFQIGVLVAVERNRQRLTQTELASSVGIGQTDVSDIENGKPGNKVTNAQVDALFAALGLEAGGLHANYVKWWRDNA